MNFNIPIKGNKKLERVIKSTEEDKELSTLWRSANVVAIDRLGYSDHGPTHIIIVSNIALKIFRMLVESGVEPGLTSDYKEMDKKDAEVVVFLASVLHDIGHAIHRYDHEFNSIPLAIPIIDRLLKDYEIEKRTILRSEVLHGIIAHKREVQPLTMEAGVVRIADALDMQQGRARIPFKSGEVNIHSVSALAVEGVSIRKGDKKPIVIEIKLTNSSGIFQIDEMLKPKMKGTGLEEYMQIKVSISGESEKRIIDEFVID